MEDYAATHGPNGSSVSTVPSYSLHPPLLTKADIKGRKPKPELLTLSDFDSDGPRIIYYLPVAARGLIELGKVSNSAELAERLIQRLSTTVVDIDGVPIMDSDDWADLPLPRLMYVMNAITDAMMGVTPEIKEEVEKNV